MDKETFKKLKPGKKIYIVELDDSCECPMCDGSCAEVNLLDVSVHATTPEKGLIWFKYFPESVNIFSAHYGRVFTRKREAESAYNKMCKELSWH